MIIKKEKGMTKKKYEKPDLRIVNISPGVQTLGIGCKLSGTGGVLGVNGNPCILGSPCASSQGS